MENLGSASSGVDNNPITPLGNVTQSQATLRADTNQSRQREHTSDIGPPGLDVVSMREPPESTDHSNRANSEFSSAAHEENLWFDNLKRLQLSFPHLKNIQNIPRVRDKTAYTCFDYSDNILKNVARCDLAANNPLAKSQFQHSVVETIPSDVQLRFVVVEDLSPWAVYILGSCFSISPEVFEEHLLDSALSSLDPKPTTWNTRHLEKDYVSLSWYRPVKRSLWKSGRVNDYRRLLDPGFSWFGQDRSAHKQEVLYRLRSVVNIFRQECPQEMSDEIFSGWTEKVTFWKTRIGHCDLGTFLFLTHVLHRS